MSAAALVLASAPRISADPAYGKTVVPSELNACANVRRLCAVRAAPSSEISGFATTCTVVMPAASTNSAMRKTANVPEADAGTNSRQPAAMVATPSAAVRM